MSMDQYYQRPLLQNGACYARLKRNNDNPSWFHTQAYGLESAEHMIYWIKQKGKETQNQFLCHWIYTTLHIILIRASFLWKG